MRSARLKGRHGLKASGLSERVATVYPTPATPADKFPDYLLLYLALGALGYAGLNRGADGRVIRQAVRDLAMDLAGLAGD